MYLSNIGFWKSSLLACHWVSIQELKIVYQSSMETYTSLEHPTPIAKCPLWHSSTLIKTAYRRLALAFLHSVKMCYMGLSGWPWLEVLSFLEANQVATLVKHKSRKAKMDPGQDLQRRVQFHSWLLLMLLASFRHNKRFDPNFILLSNIGFRPSRSIQTPLCC